LETAFEHILTNSYKADLVVYVNSHPKDFIKVLKLAISNKQPYSQKAAWLLWSCMKENDLRIRKYSNQIIKELPQKIDSQQRELLIVLEKMNLDSKDVALLFDTCVDIWQKIDKQPSIRYAAFRLLIKIAKKYPDLANELKLLTDDIYIDSLSKIARKSILQLVQNL